MSSTPAPQQHGASWILHDPDLLTEVSVELFDPAHWAGAIVGQGKGRGEAWFIDTVAGDQWVLRHYRRGGLPGRILQDAYFYLGLNHSRPIREWQVLRAAHAAGVPVPRPVAVAVHRQGLIYRGDILMQRIDDARSLADHLAAGSMTRALWETLAQAVHACHRARFWHADLNARNVLEKGGRWWLIDFDRARQREGESWKMGNLERLQRSLDKLAGAGELNYEAADWSHFLATYRQLAG